MMPGSKLEEKFHDPLKDEENEKMRCSNCGEPIEEGRLFCLNCGQEVQWVPDYDSFGSLMEQERIRKEKKEREEAEAARRRAAAAAELKRKKKKRRNITLAVSGTVLLGAVLFAVVMKVQLEKKNYNDFDYQMRMADTAFSNRKYEESYEFVQRAVALDGEDVDAQLLLAQVLASLDKEKKAVETLERVIKEHPDQIAAYGQLLKLYEKNDEVTQIRDLLAACENDKVKEKYAAYIAPDPVFSLPEGEYTDAKSLQLYVKNDKTRIYYTVDGSEPTAESTPYDGSIQLEAGTTEVNAIAFNEKWIPSQVISKTYVIQYELPDPPQISPSAGKFTTDMDTKIYIIVPEGCKAYYAFDEKPTKNSKLYDPSEPVEMLKGTHTFYAVLVDEHGQMGYPGSAIYTLTDAE